MSDFGEDFLLRAYCPALYRAAEPKAVSYGVGKRVLSVMVGSARFVGSMAVGAVPDVFWRRTPLEQKMILVGGSLVIWKLVDVGAVRFVWTGVRWLLPSCQRVNAWIWGPTVKLCESELQFSTVYESRRANSEEMALTNPTCQGYIGYYEDGVWNVCGEAVRFAEENLVSADHVAAEFKNKVLKGPKGEVSISGKTRDVLAPDLSRVKLTAADFSRVGLKVAKIAPVPSAGTRVSIVGSEGKGTVGTLTNDALLFGGVLYGGTTVAGYSGAAYMSGDMLYGIHTHGGTTNGGYSASYIWMRIKEVDGRLEEESSDWLRKQFKSGKKMRWRYSGDPEYVQVETEGRYALVTHESMTRAFGSDWHTNSELNHLANDPSYEDQDWRKQSKESKTPLSTILTDSAGEANCSKSLGVSSSSTNTQGSVAQRLQDLTDAYWSLSPTARKNFRRMNDLHGALPEGTAGPKPQPAK